MKTFHMHIAVENLKSSVKFYSALFDTEPTVLKEDYAKWLLDDPRVNFAISQRGASPGLDHIGIQVESDVELQQIQQRLAKAELPLEEQKHIACCYVRSDKFWTVDPQGIAWEAFNTLEDIPVYDKQELTTAQYQPEAACCESTLSKCC